MYEIDIDNILVITVYDEFNDIDCGSTCTCIWMSGHFYLKHDTDITGARGIFEVHWNPFYPFYISNLLTKRFV